MAWRVEYSAEAERDFDLIFDHLRASYVELGEDDEAAFRHAFSRVRHLKSEIDRLAATPHIGTLRPEMGSQIRFLRRDNAAVWFQTDDAERRLDVLAIFFGGQDHISHMLLRLLGSDEGGGA